jgi:hypothetical protein
MTAIQPDDLEAAVTAGILPQAQAAFFATLFILDACVIVLGIGWHRLRRLLLGHIFTPLARFLPPVQP